MLLPPIPQNEQERIQELIDLEILDSDQEPVFDDLVQMAADITSCPIALITLVDAERQWFKARIGIAVDQTHRDYSICAHAINHHDTFIVEDIGLDERFKDNPGVMGDPPLRYYAGEPLVTSRGFKIGTLSVVDHKPRQLTPQQIRHLKTIARQVITTIELRAENKDLKLVSRSSAGDLLTAEELRHAVEVAQIGFFSIELPTYKLKGRGRFFKHFGLNQNAELKMEDAVAALHPEDRERVLAAVTHTIETGNPYHIEYRVCVNQQVKWIEARGERTLDATGTPIQFSGSTVDITLRKRNEEKLRDERLQLDQIFENAPAAMVLWDAKTLTFERVNPEYQKIFPGRQLVGKTFADALYDLVGQGYENSVRKVLETGKPFHGHEAMARIPNAKTGVPETRYFNFTYTPIYKANNEISNVFNHAVEVTEAVKARLEVESGKLAAESANYAKSQFLANMSHEIRTPLGAIMGFSDLARQSEEDPKATEGYLEVIHRNAVQVLRIVDDILDLSKVEAGKVSVEEIDTNLITFLAEFASTMRLRARENGIHFEIEAATNLPDHLSIDPTRVRQVLMNAVGNALKFTSKGTVSLIVSYEYGVLKFTVKDTGRGISEDQAKNLFQAFVQADTSTTRKYGGTGLGLILTKKLCQAMGGDYSLEHSELGVGSRFVATLRGKLTKKSVILDRAGITFTADYKRPEMDSRILALKNTKVLVVEDSPDNQNFLKIILEKHGVQFSLAQNGLEGIEMAMNGNHDLVLMDIQMPVLDGYEAVQRLRKQGYSKPVVALTAHAMKEEYDRALRSGFTDYLTKPVDKKNLIETIARLANSPLS